MNHKSLCCYIEQSEINRLQAKNKKLVNLLNHKMFKGFRTIFASNSSKLKKPKSIDNIYWENKSLEPFDDNYNIEYKKEKLSSLYHNYQLNRAINIEHFSNKKQITKNFSLITNKNFKKRTNLSLQKNKQLNQKTKQSQKKKYFYLTSNPKNLKLNQEQLNLYKQIFGNLYESNFYNDIPFFAINKIRSLESAQKKINKFKYLPDKQARILDSHFLYELSHCIKSFDNIHNNQKKKSYYKGFINHNIHSSNYKEDVPLINTSFDLSKEIVNLGNNEKEFILIGQNPRKKRPFSHRINNNIRENIYKGNIGRLIKINYQPYIKRNTSYLDKIYFDNTIFPTRARLINDEILREYKSAKKIKFLKLKELIG